MKSRLNIALLLLIVLVSCDKPEVVSSDNNNKKDVTTVPEPEEIDLTAEKQALMDLFNSSKGSDWTNKQNWGSDKKFSEWFGITTDKDGYVTAIDLHSNNLDGTIPESIKNLSHLKSLNLKKNHIRTPIPSSLQKMSVWTEAWGDILFGNDVYKEDFLALNVSVPEYQKKKMSKDTEYTFFLQWTPRKDGLSDDEFQRDSLAVDAFKQYWYDQNVDVVAWCVSVPADEIRSYSEKASLPWESASEKISYPIKGLCPVWVLVDRNGLIVDTNILKSRTPDPEEVIPGQTPLSITVRYPSQLTYKPGADADLEFAQNVSVTTNKNPDLVCINLRSSVDWIGFIGSNIIVNGNASVHDRYGDIYMDIYYGTYRYKTISIPVIQKGVSASIISTSNIDEFDITKGADLGAYTTVYTPYGGSETLVLRHNADDVLLPTSSAAGPVMITADGYNSEQSYPTLSAFESRAVENSFYHDDYFSFAYSSNRTNLANGCALSYYPVVYVFEDWNDLIGSTKAYYVDNGKGEALRIQTLYIQPQAYIYAEYDNYLSEAIAGSSAEVKGYNKLKAYKDLSSKSTYTDEIKINSTVSWTLSAISLEEESWQYTIHDRNGTPTSTSVVADGKHLTEFAMDVYVGDYLKTTSDDNHYRPPKACPTRWTALRVYVDLNDGLSPILVPLAYVGQAGIPFTYVTGMSGGSCYKGEYPFEGHDYSYKLPFEVQYVTYSDDVTDYFCGNPEFAVNSVAGQSLDEYNRWVQVPKWAESFSAVLYTDFDADHVLTVDWRVPLSTGVSVYAMERAQLNWVYVEIPVEDDAPRRNHVESTYRGSKYRGKPRIKEPTVDLSNRFMARPVENVDNLMSVKKHLDIPQSDIVGSGAVTRQATLR